MESPYYEMTHDFEEENRLFQNGYIKGYHDAMIKRTQEAKLLTFDEVKKHYSIPGKFLEDIRKYIDYSNDIEPLYLECNIEDAWVVHWRDYHSIAMNLEDWEKDYGKTWRCWTKKPTEEQKRSVKWE